MKRNKRLNRHHVFFTRREHSQTKENCELREALIIPTLIVQHDLLHEEVMPPIVPNPRLAREMLRVMSQENYSPIERLDALCTHLGHIAHYGYKDGLQARLLHVNLMEQREYLE